MVDSHGTNYGEQLKSLGASGVVVRLAGFGSLLVEGGGVSVGDRAPKWHYLCWHWARLKRMSMDDSCEKCGCLDVGDW